MSHDIFISYHPVDQEDSEAVVKALESAGFTCWIAHRDLSPDAPADASIAWAIQESRVLVLVLTACAVELRSVRREVELADAKAIPVFVFGAEDKWPEEMNILIELRQYNNRWPPPVAVSLSKLAMEERPPWLEEWLRLLEELRQWRVEELQWLEERRWLEEERQRLEKERLEGKQLEERWRDLERDRRMGRGLGRQRRRWLEMRQRLEPPRQPEEWEPLEKRQGLDEEMRRWLEGRRRWLEGRRRWLEGRLAAQRQRLEEERQRLEKERLEGRRRWLEEELHRCLEEIRRPRKLGIRSQHEIWREWLEEELHRLEKRQGPRQEEVGPITNIVTIIFLACYPKEVAVQTWQPFLAYIFRPSAAEVVEADACERLGRRFDEYRLRAGATHQPIAVGATITATPKLEGFQFNPPSLTIELQEDWHRLEFKLRAREEMVGRASNGMLTFTVEGVIIADIPISIYVGKHGSAAGMAVTSGRPYQAIFCSYSHRDKRVVKRVESVCGALGISYLRDVIALRSGQFWRDELHALIERADIFQLFWSHNAARSKNVEEEWRHALELGREATGFIRPVYWEEPIPQPPAELEPLHFTFVPEFSPWLRRCVSLAYRFGARLVRHSGRG